MAFEFYVTVEGTKQGKFKGEGMKDKHKEKIAGLAFEYSVVSPRDLATGQASGKRQHHPIKITKEWGASTPQLFTACTTNEVLKEVHFEFLKTDANGEETVFYTVKLTNASVSHIAQFTSPHEGSGGAKSEPTKFLESIEFTFQKIEIESKTGKTSAMDDWHK